MMCHMTTSLTAAAAGFFAALAASNTREHWDVHRARYDTDLRPRLVALLDAVPGWGPWRVYRPHNDTRFRNTPPYKEFLGGVCERADGVGAFVRLDAEGLLVATGVPMPAADQLARLRAAFADERSGAAFRAAAEGVAATGPRVHAGRYAPLVRVPKGYPADHPRADLLRWKGVEVTARPGVVGWPDEDDGGRRLGAALDRGEPVHAWLAAHVGPSALTPEERFARTAPRRAAAG